MKIMIDHENERQHTINRTTQTVFSVWFPAEKRDIPEDSPNYTNCGYWC